MLSSLSRQAGALVRLSALQVECATAHGSTSACEHIAQALQTSSAPLGCSRPQSCGASYGTAAVDWEEAASSSSIADRTAGSVSTTAAPRSWRRAVRSSSSVAMRVMGWAREDYEEEPRASVASLVAPFTGLALRVGLGGGGGILAARRLRGEPEPFEDEQDDDEYEDGEYVDLDDEDLLGDLDELDEMEIDGEWDEGEWEEDREREEELGEGEERPGAGAGAGTGAGAGAGEGRKGGVMPPLPPSPRPGRDWRS